MSNTPRTDKAADESIVAVYETSKQLERELSEMTQNFKAEKERAEMFKDQREKLIEAMKAHLPFIPNMEPIGAAAQSESNRTAWNLRKTLEEMKGLKQ